MRPPLAVLRPRERRGDLLWIGYADFEVYHCEGQCGAVASPSGSDVWGAGWPVEEVEAALCEILKAVRGRCATEVNYVSDTDPPLLLLWARWRAGRRLGGHLSVATAEGEPRLWGGTRH